VLDDLRGGHATIQVGGNLARKQFPGSLPPRAIALQTTGNEVIRIVGTVASVGPQVVKRKPNAPLYSVTTVAAG